jgi:methylenetetrahydrofolate dehydrogenase (NADP+)/methenyltetrahydrofolate cyclohydrolase
MPDPKPNPSGPAAIPPAKRIDGKAFADDLRAALTDEIRDLRDLHRAQPGLAVLMVGADPASDIYVRSKVKQTQEVGMKSVERRLPTDIKESELLLIIEGLNDDDAIHGILVQLPLPRHISADRVIRAIAPHKDVDGFHPLNAGLLMTTGKGLVPCTPLGCSLLLKDRLGDLSGMEAVVVGRSNIVGKPMGQLLLRENCTVTMAHSKTADLAGTVRRADIVVAAVGVPELIKGDWIKPGATVIDVGMNRLPLGGGKTRLCGDVDTQGALAHCAGITPVPGGVGPMTIACLLRNTVTACKRINGIAE